MTLIPCMHCKKEYGHKHTFFRCETCGFRVCAACLSKHKGQYGSGFKCSQCRFGKMKKN